MHYYIKDIIDDSIVLSNFDKDDITIAKSDIASIIAKGNTVLGYNSMTKDFVIKTEDDLGRYMLSKSKLTGSKLSTLIPKKQDDLENISKSLSIEFDKYKRVINAETHITMETEDTLKAVITVPEDCLEYANVVNVRLHNDLVEYLNTGINLNDVYNLKIIYDIDTMRVKIINGYYKLVPRTENILKQCIKATDITFTDRCNFKNIIALPYVFSYCFDIANMLNLSQLDFSSMQYYDNIFAGTPFVKNIEFPDKINPNIKTMYKAFWGTYGTYIDLGLNSNFYNFLKGINNIEEPFKMFNWSRRTPVALSPKVLTNLLLNQEDSLMYRVPVNLQLYLDKEMLNTLSQPDLFRRLLKEYTHRRGHIRLTIPEDLTASDKTLNRFVELFVKTYKESITKPELTNDWGHSLIKEYVMIVVKSLDIQHMLKDTITKVLPASGDYDSIVIMTNK